MSYENPVIVWFRQDLRIGDNLALTQAASDGIILPIYILDDEDSGSFAIGAASRWWLNESLQKLNTALDNKLCFFKGSAEEVLKKLVNQVKPKAVYWNRCYEPWRIDRDQKIKTFLEKEGIKRESFNGSLLWEPWEVLKKDKTPYRVFTPFYKKGCLMALAPRKPIAKPSNMVFYSDSVSNLSLKDLHLLPEIPWYDSLVDCWSVGEDAAQNQLKQFLKNRLNRYKIGRDHPGQCYVSRLSPHLHFGEISPNQVWYAANKMSRSENLDHFLSELGWREFSYHLLYHFPDLPTVNFQTKFDQFPWRSNSKSLKNWQEGKTGIPIVDAGMRELWQTGYMHNRVRMIVGSFLVKNLLIDWREGEKWFWDCLVDADLASNSASWQWIAGSGADAAPYFRIFNPVTQGQKFDADGEYTLKYVPELKKMPKKYLFNPWEAPENVLREANLSLGVDYPLPIIDLKKSRQEALDAFSSIKQTT